MNSPVDDTVERFKRAFGPNAITTAPTGGHTVVKQTNASLPLDNPDLNNDVAVFDTLREMYALLELHSARLDGITEGLSAIAGKLDRPAPAAAAAPAHKPYGGGGGGEGGASAPGAQRQQYVVQEVWEEQVPKRAGGTFTKYWIQFANGYKRDTVKKQFADYFAARVGQPAPYTEIKNDKGFREISAVG